MAIALNNSNTNGGDTATITVTGLTCSGANRVAIAVAGSANGAFCTGITYDGVAMTFLGQDVRTDICYLDVYYLINPPTAASNIVATWSAAQTGGAALDVLVYTGMHQTTPFGTPASEDNAGTSVTGAGGVTTASGDLTFDAVSWSASGGATITATGTGHTQRATQNPIGGWELTAGDMTGSGTITPTWTISTSQDWSQLAVTMKAVAGNSAPMFRGS